MSTDSSHVRVVGLEEKSIRFVLTLTQPGCFWLDEAFVLDLFGLRNGNVPDVVGGPPIGKPELAKTRRTIEDREPEKIVASVQVSDIENYPSDYVPTLERFRDHPRETWPRATYEVRLRIKDLMSFVSVGTEIASTAFDERRTGAMVLPGGEIQKRWPGEPFPHVFSAKRVGDAGVEVQVSTGGELPAPCGWSWLDIVRKPLRAIESDLPLAFDMSARAMRYLKSVQLVHAEGPREAGGTVYLSSGVVKTSGAVRTARYHIELTDPKWLERHTLDQPWGISGRIRSLSFTVDPEPSTAGELEVFEEMRELASAEGVTAELAWLEEGLRGSREVVIAALKRAGALGSTARPLASIIAPRIAALDPDVVSAASAAAAAIDVPDLASWLALASLRAPHTDADRRAANDAARTLGALTTKPAWCDAFAHSSH